MLGVGDELATYAEFVHFGLQIDVRVTNNSTNEAASNETQPSSIHTRKSSPTELPF